MKIAFFGAEGKVGCALVPLLERAGHEVRGIEIGEEPDVAGLDAAVERARGARPGRVVCRRNDRLGSAGIGRQRS
jgi:nucleoside-diphosphate-sugar epimerase